MISFITGKKLFKSTGLPKLLQNDSSRWSKKNPEKHLKNWRPHLHSWFNNKKETGPEWHPWESSKAKTTADQKEQKRSSRICQNTSWWSSRPKIFCGQTKEKFSFLKGLSPVTSGTKLTQPNMSGHQFVPWSSTILCSRTMIWNEWFKKQKNEGVGEA